MGDATTSERWLPVVGWEGLYEVSDLGRVRSLDRIVIRLNQTPCIHRGRVLKQKKTSNGPYWRISLCIADKNYYRLVHVLVMQAFIGPKPPGMECLHGPNGSLDASLVNLSYGTHSQNILDTNRDGTNYYRKLTHCAWGHVLDKPNLVPSALKHGFRLCLACNRANSLTNQAKRRGKVLDRRGLADGYYTEIMKHSS